VGLAVLGRSFGGGGSTPAGDSHFFSRRGCLQRGNRARQGAGYPRYRGHRSKGPPERAPAPHPVAVWTTRAGRQGHQERRRKQLPSGQDQDKDQEKRPNRERVAGTERPRRRGATELPATPQKHHTRRHSGTRAGHLGKARKTTKRQPPYQQLTARKKHQANNRGGNSQSPHNSSRAVPRPENLTRPKQQPGDERPPNHTSAQHDPTAAPDKKAHSRRPSEVRQGVPGRGARQGTQAEGAEASRCAKVAKSVNPRHSVTRAEENLPVWGPESNNQKPS